MTVFPEKKGKKSLILNLFVLLFCEEVWETEF